MRTPHPAQLLSLLVAACGARTGLDDLGGGAHADAGRACDATAFYAYAADSARTLYRYDPRTGHATRLGTPACAMSGGAWTMTATRQHAYLVDDADWSIHAVDLATLGCARTAFDRTRVGLQPEFGVAAAGTGADARVYVYGITSSSSVPALFVCDAARFACTTVGALHPAPTGAFPVNLTFNELTGTLVAYAPELPGAALLELDAGN